MGTVSGHMENARREKGDFIGAAKSQLSKNAVAQHLHLCVENALKAILAYESGSRLNSGDRTHSLGELYSRVNADLSEFEDFIYKIDANYVLMRYDSGFSGEYLKGWGRIASTLENFISAVEGYVDAQLAKK